MSALQTLDGKWISPVVGWLLTKTKWENTMCTNRPSSQSTGIYAEPTRCQKLGKRRYVFPSLPSTHGSRYALVHPLKTYSNLQTLCRGFSHNDNKPYDGTRFSVQPRPERHTRNGHVVFSPSQRMNWKIHAFPPPPSTYQWKH
jgi:hypothetical protein